MEDRPVKGQKSTEHLSHFSCGTCGKWWSVGDAPADRGAWFCPWCGEEQDFVPAASKA